MPGGGGTQNLPRAVGERRAKELILTGAPVQRRRRRYEWGLVNALCEPAKLLAGGARHRARDRRQRAAVGAPGEEVDPLRPADRPRDRLPLRDRGLQPAGRHRGPARGRARLQREAQTQVRRDNEHERSAPTCMPLGEDYPGNPRQRAAHLRRFSRRVLARARRARGLPDRVRQRADRGGLSRRADPGGIRRRGPAAARRGRDARGMPRRRLLRRRAAHAQMYTMGSVLRHGSAEQKAKYLPEIASGELRLQAFGVTEPTTGTDTTKLKTRAVRDGDHYVDQRAEGLDLARAALRPDAAARAHHAARPGEEEDRRPVGVPGRHPRVPAARAWRSGRSRR